MQNLTCCFMVIAVFATVSCAVKQGRMFRRQPSTRRTDTPRTTMDARFEVSCASRCYGEWWCQAFNLNRAAQQCDLFDSSSNSGQLEIDSEVSYSEKASNEMRPCLGLPVENGKDVSSGVPHEETANITCNPYFQSNHTQVICYDGAFRPVQSIAAAAPAIQSVDCEFACPADGMMVSHVCFDFVDLVGGTTFADAVSTCGSIADGSLAVALPETVRQFTVDQLAIGLYAYVGLLWMGGVGGEWQWVNSGNLSDAVGITTANTIAPLWLTIIAQPSGNAFEPYAVLLRPANYLNVGGVGDVTDGQANSVRALCQISNMNYVFTPLEVGKRISSPTERSVNGTDFEGCRKSCLSSVFCRAFSYSIGKSVCLQHSLPPTPGETTLSVDADFTVYA